MTWPIQLADGVLIAVVTGMAVGVAYLHAPRAKSLLYMLPIPFSAALVATGKGVDATHVIGVLGVWGFLWVGWFLHRRLRVPILLADLVAIGIHCLFSVILARVVPGAGAAARGWFIGSCLVALAAGAMGVALVHEAEPGHRSPMPAYIKAPLVFLLVLGLVLAKEPLRGFMPTFPMVTVFAVYEARHSLRTLARRFHIFVLGFLPMALLVRGLLPRTESIRPVEYLLPLLAAWAAYLPVYLGLDRWERMRASRSGHLQSPAPG